MPIRNDMLVEYVTISVVLAWNNKYILLLRIVIIGVITKENINFLLLNYMSLR